MITGTKTSLTWFDLLPLDSPVLDRIIKFCPSGKISALIGAYNNDAIEERPLVQKKLTEQLTGEWETIQKEIQNELDRAQLLIKDTEPETKELGPSKEQIQRSDMREIHKRYWKNPTTSDTSILYIYNSTLSDELYKAILQFKQTASIVDTDKKIILTGVMVSEEQLPQLYDSKHVQCITPHILLSPKANERSAALFKLIMRVIRVQRTLMLTLSILGALSSPALLIFVGGFGTGFAIIGGLGLTAIVTSAAVKWKDWSNREFSDQYWMDPLFPNRNSLAMYCRYFKGVKLLHELRKKNRTSR